MSISTLLVEMIVKRLYCRNVSLQKGLQPCDVAVGAPWRHGLALLHKRKPTCLA